VPARECRGCEHTQGYAALRIPANPQLSTIPRLAFSGTFNVLNVLNLVSRLNTPLMPKGNTVDCVRSDQLESAR
jgi:hypothetical protein